MKFQNPILNFDWTHGKTEWRTSNIPPTTFPKKGAYNVELVDMCSQRAVFFETLINTL